MPFTPDPAPNEDPPLTELADAITEMRSRLQEQIRTVDRQRRNLAMLVAALEEGVLVADDGGHVMLSNPAARRILGGADEAGGEADVWRGRLMETVVGHHELQTMLLTEPGGDRRTGERTVEVDGPDARRVTLRARARDIPLEVGGEVPTPGRLLVLTDITELAQSLRMKADFVANASHELRTPLNALHMALENLTTMDPVAERGIFGRFLRMALGHTRRLEALVKDMLDLSRVESPAARFQSEPLRPADWFAELQDRFTERLAARNLVWELDCPPGAVIRGNNHLLGLIFDNLVDNAIKFTPQGGRVAVTVRPVGDARPPAQYDLAVSDSGCGIPPEDQARVFERFYQVDRSRSGPERGTGLGLSIVKHAVAALEGSVRLESEPGKGTTITVTLPAAGGRLGG